MHVFNCYLQNVVKPKSQQTNKQMKPVVLQFPHVKEASEFQFNKHILHFSPKVYGDKDADGFYRGETGGRLGYVPCNMVSEIQVEDEETRQQLLQQGFLSTAASMEKIGM